MKVLARFKKMDFAGTTPNFKPSSAVGAKWFSHPEASECEAGSAGSA